MGVTVDDARTIAAALSRSYEALVRDRFRFRVGQIVYAAFSQDETIMGSPAPQTCGTDGCRSVSTRSTLHDQRINISAIERHQHHTSLDGREVHNAMVVVKLVDEGMRTQCQECIAG
jgi:hypothetical protein